MIKLQITLLTVFTLSYMVLQTKNCDQTYDTPAISMLNSKHLWGANADRSKEPENCSVKELQSKVSKSLKTNIF